MTEVFDGGLTSDLTGYLTSHGVDHAGVDGRASRAADASAYTRTTRRTAGTRIEVPEPAGHPSGNSHTARAVEAGYLVGRRRC